MTRDRESSFAIQFMKKIFFFSFCMQSELEWFRFADKTRQNKQKTIQTT